MDKSIFNRSGEFTSTDISPEIYDNSSEKNGYAVVINNFDFGGLHKNLLGRDDDSKKLQDTFSGLNFDVKIYENKPKDEMLSIFKDYGEKDHSEFNMFACVISSHGSDESIFGSDAKSVLLIELVRSIINCKSLEGKPKLFFIDACRTLSKNSKFVELSRTADNLFCYSTLEGQTALTLNDSQQSTGSVFCRVLCDILTQYGHEIELHEILHHLKFCMNNEDNGTKVETLDTLNKTLWFIPKSHGENYKWSVAIDFGTCMSGFAYSTSEEFNNSPLLIFHKQCWNEESTNRNTMKTATCLLLNSNKELVAFGFDAQAKFAGLQLEDKHTQYYYFHNFKMAVYNQQKSLKGLQIIDIQDKRVAVRDVFVESIKAIKQEVLKTLVLQYNDVNEKNIRWVLTVPAIWPDDAKLFMRECAQEAKLPWEQLLIALEPEAASIYCQFLAINKERNLSDGFQITDIGTKYMILDVGGGTTDITVHEKEKNGQLRELKKASGRNIGSTYINEKIMEIFEDIFGKTLMNKLKIEKPDAYLDLCWEIEAIKKTVMTGTQNEVRIALSYPAFNTLSLREQKRTIADVIACHNNSENAMKVQLKDDKIVIQKEHLLKHFRCLVELIIKEAKSAMESIDVSLIILVGGLADCKFLTEKMKVCFPLKRIITPEDANLAVLKGAVLYGHKPNFIDPRITKFTYGIEVLGRFDEKLHDRYRRQEDGWGNYCCKNAFDLIIHQNESVPLGKVIQKRYCTGFPDQKTVSLNVFTSNIDKPLYTDDGSCRKIGMLSIVIPDPSKGERSVDVQFIFGDTELKVMATEHNFGGKKERIFFLG